MLYRSRKSTIWPTPSWRRRFHRCRALARCLSAANAKRPKGAFQDASSRWAIYDNDQIFKAEDYRPIIAGINKTTGAAVRVGDLGTVTDSVSNILTGGV